MMNKKYRFLHGLMLAFLVSATACGGDEPSGPTATPTASGDVDGGARTLEIPGQQMPEGHPAVEGGSQGGRLTWQVPEGWIEEPPSNTMRVAQYKVPGPGGDGECVVYYFGPGQGGGALANAQRWAGQFGQPDGSSSVDAMTMKRLESTRRPVDIVEVTGTYEGGMTGSAQPATPQENYMLLGAIAEGPDAPWFFKFTGPEATVRDQRGSFVQMLESIP
jgi:hypothetical protein